MATNKDFVIKNGLTIGSDTTTSGIITRTTASGKARWMQQDGTGRQHWYWNTAGGTATYEVGTEGVTDVMHHADNLGGEYFLFRAASGVGKNAGDPVTWQSVLYATRAGVFQFLGSDVVTAANISTYSTGLSVTSTINIAGGLINQIPFQSATGTTVFSTALTFTSSTGVLASTSFSGAGTGLTGTAASLNIGGTATYATNQAGGAANQIQYNTAVNASSFIAAPTTANTYLQWNGSAFAWSTLPFDIAQFINGKPLASEILVKVIFPRAVSFPANFTNSYAKCVVAPTASTVLTILKNGISVGTLTFAASATTGTFATSALSFSAADLMIIQAPASVDATFADFACMLTGA
jgi:hypothetical protein